MKYTVDNSLLFGKINRVERTLIGEKIIQPKLNKDTGYYEFYMFGKTQSFDDEETAMEQWMLIQNWMFSDPE